MFWPRLSENIVFLDLWSKKWFLEGMQPLKIVENQNFFHFQHPRILKISFQVQIFDFCEYDKFEILKLTFLQRIRQKFQKFEDKMRESPKMVQIDEFISLKLPPWFS